MGEEGVSCLDIHGNGQKEPRLCGGTLLSTYLWGNFSWLSHTSLPCSLSSKLNFHILILLRTHTGFLLGLGRCSWVKKWHKSLALDVLASLAGSSFTDLKYWEWTVWPWRGTQPSPYWCLWEPETAASFCAPGNDSSGTPHQVVPRVCRRRWEKGWQMCTKIQIDRWIKHQHFTAQ